MHVVHTIQQDAVLYQLHHHSRAVVIGWDIIKRVAPTATLAPFFSAVLEDRPAGLQPHNSSQDEWNSQED